MGKNMRIKTAPKANRVPLLGDGVGALSLSLPLCPAAQRRLSYSNLVSDCVRWCVQETSRALSDLEEGSNVQVRRPAPFPQTPRSLPPPRANQLINLPLSLSVVFFIVKIGIISARERRVLSSNQVGE
jgi:hypothetical protein